MRDLRASVGPFLLVVVLSLAGGVLASLYLRTPSDVTLFWPGAGIGFAAIYVWGPRYALAVAAAQLLLHLFWQSVPAAFLPFSIASNVLGLLAGVAYARRGVDAPMRLSSRHGLRLLRGGIVAGGIGASIGVLGMWLAGLVPIDRVGGAFALWWLGDLLGMTALGPTMLLLFGRHQFRPGMLWRNLEGGRRERIAWALLLGLSLAAMQWLGRSGNPFALGMFGLPLALLLWAAARYSPLTVTLSTAAVVVYVSTVTGLGLGGFMQPGNTLDAVVLILLLLVGSVIPVLLQSTIADQRATAAALYKRATRDPLTGLLNRSAFEEQAREILLSPVTPQALAYFDLDHLKLVNDSTSHAAGDELIRNVGSAISASFGPDALVSRTGGDEFAVLMPSGANGATAACRRALARIEALRVPWKELTLNTSASIGLVPSQPPHPDFETLYSHADAACFAAKELGGNRIYQIEPGGSELESRKKAMGTALLVREALEQQRFHIFCQPIVDLRREGPQQQHFECLLRWEDNTGRLCPPADLIAAAERYRMGPRLDRYVVERVLQWLERHPAQLQAIGHCSINLGAASLTDDQFCDFLEARLRRSSVPPQRLCLEITETSALHDIGRARRFIARMRDAGCHFALDDFGTGFCSFGYLRELDVDYLKIDGSFVREMEASEMAQAVVRSIADIAHVLDKRTIAEQAETHGQLDRLRAIGVDYAQGYVYAKPRPIDEFFAAA